jgi:hypothetical protein
MSIPVLLVATASRWVGPVVVKSVKKKPAGEEVAGKGDLTVARTLTPVLGHQIAIRGTRSLAGVSKQAQKRRRASRQ